VDVEAMNEGLLFQPEEQIILGKDRGADRYSIQQIHFINCREFGIIAFL